MTPKLVYTTAVPLLFAAAPLFAAVAFASPSPSPSPAPSGPPAAPAAASAPLSTGSAGPPRSEKRAVSDAYHGVSVVDDYRWLEDFSDPAVKQWNEAQNRWTRQI